MSSKCSKCSKLCNDNDSVNCDVCKKTLHAACAGITRQEADCLRSSRRRIHFFCDNCNLIDSITALNNKISSLEVELNTLKNEIRSSDKMTMVSEDKKTMNDTMDEEHLIAEIIDRQNRAKNLIVYNLQETLTDTPTDDDMQKFISVINNEAITGNSISNLRRLGKKSHDNIRPLLVSLTSPSDAVTILKTYKTRDRIYINRDLTVQQRNQAYITRNEFKNRKEKGENVKLKYINGMPKIVMVN